ncbi:MAG: hypothetical protein WCA77_00110 [Thermoplasmata archaeon]
MPSYFGLWSANRAIQPPVDPNVAVQQFEGFLALVKSQLQSGALKEVHEFVEGGRGYFFTGDHPAEKIYEVLAAWSPWVTFEVHETVKFPKPLEVAVAVWKQRAAMMK